MSDDIYCKLCNKNITKDIDSRKKIGLLPTDVHITFDAENPYNLISVCDECWGVMGFDI